MGDGASAVYADVYQKGHLKANSARAVRFDSCPARGHDAAQNPLLPKARGKQPVRREYLERVLLLLGTREVQGQVLMF
jgi:hypothetical protein